jgi:cytidine deaminase
LQEIDELVRQAAASRERAYAPYSRFRVGCALEAESGAVYLGCNVENASYGLTMCAERVAVGSALVAGERRFRRLVLVADSAEPVTPCGACRQVLVELAADAAVVSVGEAGETRRWTVAELLPRPFVLESDAGSHGGEA